MNAWTKLAAFFKSWWGVATTIVTVLVAVIGFFMAWGREVGAVLAMPERAEAHERRDSAQDARMDSLTTALTAALEAQAQAIDNQVLYLNLFRCEQMGHPAHECPLLQDRMGLEPLPATAARAEVPLEDGT